MKIMCGLAFLLLFLPIIVSAHSVCPNEDTLRVVDSNNVYVGEIHGAEQPIAFVRCLLNRAIDRKRQVVLSLELPSEAADPASDFWKGIDGRSSQAMHGLLVYAKSLENSGRVSIHYQYANSGPLDERLGGELVELARGSRVIALSGNYHARRLPLPNSRAPRPAGSQLDSSFVNVLVATANGGHAWVCLGGNEDGCKEHELPMSKSGKKAGEWVRGEYAGYDYVYFYDKFSASRPFFRK